MTPNVALHLQADDSEVMRRLLVYDAGQLRPLSHPVASPVIRTWGAVGSAVSARALGRS